MLNVSDMPYFFRSFFIPQSLSGRFNCFNLFLKFTFQNSEIINFYLLIFVGNLRHTRFYTFKCQIVGAILFYQFVFDAGQYVFCPPVSLLRLYGFT